MNDINESLKFDINDINELLNIDINNLNESLNFDINNLNESLKIDINYINKSLNFIGFNYIVKKQKQEKICFGSGKPRNIGSKTGMNSFMRYYECEDFPNTGPGRYDVLGAFKSITSKPCAKSFSRKGYGGLGRFGVSITHTEDYPAPCEYNVPSFPANVKEVMSPFGSTAKRKSFDVNRNPG